jgi:predicted aspartyl protease
MRTGGAMIVMAASIIAQPVLLASLQREPVSPPASLGELLGREGFEKVPLQRRFGNHLWLRASLNGRSAKLVIDNSAPVTLIHRDSVGTYGLALINTHEPVLSLFGPTGETYGRSLLHSLRIGQHVFSDLPVAVANEAVSLDPPEYLIVGKLKPNAKRRKFSSYCKIENVNGLLGADVLRKSSAVLDCGHQVLYLAPISTASGRSKRLAAFLRDRGFTRVPMHLTHDGQYSVDAVINGQSTRLLVNTGASFTVLGRKAGAAMHVRGAPLRFAYALESGSLRQISGGWAKDVMIGDFSMHDVDITLVDVSPKILRLEYSEEKTAGMLGLENLSFNYAVIDFADTSLYLRRADHRSALFSSRTIEDSSR